VDCRLRRKMESYRLRKSGTVFHLFPLISFNEVELGVSWVGREASSDRQRWSGQLGKT
jgi:hypothetical protein